MRFPEATLENAEEETAQVQRKLEAVEFETWPKETPCRGARRGTDSCPWTVFRPRLRFDRGRPGGRTMTRLVTSGVGLVVSVAGMVVRGTC